MTYFEDVAAITALAHRYCSAINRADYDTIANCYTEDAVSAFKTPPRDDGTEKVRQVQGGPAIAEFVRTAYEERGEFVVQLISLVDVVSVDGDVGHLYTYIEARIKSRDGGSLYLIGVWDDYVARFEDDWRFTKRTGHSVYWDRNSVTGVGRQVKL